MVAFVSGILGSFISLFLWLYQFWYLLGLYNPPKRFDICYFKSPATLALSTLFNILFQRLMKIPWVWMVGVSFFFWILTGCYIYHFFYHTNLVTHIIYSLPVTCFAQGPPLIYHFVPYVATFFAEHKCLLLISLLLNIVKILSISRGGTNIFLTKDANTSWYYGSDVKEHYHSGLRI